MVTHTLLNPVVKSDNKRKSFFPSFRKQSTEEDILVPEQGSQRRWRLPKLGRNVSKEPEETFTFEFSDKLVPEHKKKIKCRTCDNDISEEGGSLSGCKFCNNLRQNLQRRSIKRPFHSSHPLKLCTDNSQTFICNSCHKMHENVDMYFTCNQCDFFMDVKCMFMPQQTEYDDFESGKLIQHPTHQHRMPLIKDGSIDDDVSCFVCRLKCSGEVCYGCKRCDYFLHESCAQLPPQIYGSSFHNEHPLCFHTSNRAFPSCKSCKKDNLIFTYECGKCDCILCVNCASTIPHGVKFDYHEHPLYLHQRTDEDNLILECDWYDSYCKRPTLIKSEEFNCTKSYIFWCAKCDFKVHMLCGLLPKSITCEYHMHPLVLVDLAIENEFGEYGCDICEGERDPRFCVYFCEDCKFVAHVHCLTSQIMNVLEGDLENVELHTVGEMKLSDELIKLWVEQKEQDRSVSTLMDLLYQVSEDEKEWLADHFHWDDNKNKTLLATNERTTDIEEVLRFSNFTGSQQFVSVLFDEFRSSFQKTKFEMKSTDLSLRVVHFKGYLIPLNLGTVLNSILDKYGDIGGKSSKFSPAMKSIGIFFTCKMLKQMNSTLVADINKHLLRDWYFYIIFAKEIMEFEVEFLVVSLKKITQVFFCQEVSKLLGVDISSFIQSKMAELENEKAECKMVLKKFNEFQESSSSNEYLKERLNEGLKLKWRTAGEVNFEFHN
ncbi:hypothetical protein CsatB_015379 [Cannabis sativa]